MMSPMPRLLIIATLLFTIGCNDRTRAASPRSDNPLQPDLGILTDAAFDQPVRGLCVPGSRRCVTENSPLHETCSDDGTTFGRGACGDGDVCREGDCVRFTCVPRRPLCIGATTAAICGASGDAVEDPVECDDADVCVGGTCVDPCELAREARSYITCGYTAVELPNLYQELATTERAPFAIVVANPATLVSARVTVRDGGEIAALREPFLLAPGPNYGVGVTTALASEILLAGGGTEPLSSASDAELAPGSAAVFMVQGSGVYDISSTRPVVAYQFSPYCCNFTATNDASLLLPSSSWGTRYRVLGYPAWRLSDDAPWTQAYFTVVSKVPTTVRITSPVSVVAEDGQSGTSLEFELQPGQPLQLSTTAVPEDDDDSPNIDFTGAVVESDDVVGVFTGHPCTFVPTDQWACDHLQEMLLPAEILGNRYLLTPVRRRSRLVDELDADVREATYWRIVADEPSELKFAPALSELETLAPSNRSSPACDDHTVLAAGEFCEFGTTEPTSLTGTGAMLVAGIISGHQSTGVRVYGSQAGDPSLFVLPPVAQFRTSYAFVSPPTFKRTYVTVAAARSAPLTLDGRSVPDSQRLQRRLIELGGQSWEVFTIAIEPGVHTMQADTRFGIVAYAYDDYVSYAFTGGLDLVPKGSRPEP